VPKMKSHKGTAKRIGVTGTGQGLPRQVVAWSPPRAQVLAAHRRYDGKAIVTGESIAQVRRLLPYLGV